MKRLNVWTMAAATGLALSASAFAQNTGAVLTAGTATYRIGGSSTATLQTTSTSTAFSPTMDMFTTGTSTDQIFAAWWGYRTGADTREFNLANASSRVVTANTATYAYSMTSGLTASLNYNFSQPVAGSALMTETITITNPGASAVSLNLFHYLDTNLIGGDANDFGTLTQANQRMTIADGSTVMDYWGVGAANYQVGSWPAIRDLLANTSVDNFNNTGLPYTGSDYSGGYQWVVEIPAGGAASFVSSYGVNTAAVPAPGALALVASAGLVAGRRRRRSI